MMARRSTWIVVGAAIVACIAFLHWGPSHAFAADLSASLGGNCCADLEERVAELEAITAKKGNRKVSLTISGWVGEQVMYWNDGTESNVYVGGLGRTLSTHVKLSGEAVISPDWSAGYVVHLEAISNDALEANQLGHSSSAFETFETYWFIKSKQLGKVSIGKQSTASDNAAILVDGSGSMVPANWVLFDNSAFFLRNANGALLPGTWGDLGYCNFSRAGLGGDCTAGPLNSVRYDSPAFQGFSVSADWGEDDFWDVTGRYGGELGGFKLAGAASFARSNDATMSSIGASQSVDYYQGGVYVEHIATGLFVYGAYGAEKNGAQGNDGNRWYAKAGARERWTKLGHTVLYAEYGEANDMYNGGALDTFSSQSQIICCIGLTTTTFAETVDNSKLTQYGVGVVQEIDAAAMSLWLSYRHYQGDYSGTTLATCTNVGAGSCSGASSSSAAGKFDRDLQDFDVLKFGALINF